MEELATKFVTRKFIAATGTAIIMTMCWILCQFLPLSREYFGTLVTGLAGTLAVYSGANVVQDHVMGRVPSQEHVETNTVTRTVSNTPSPPSQAQPHQAEPIID